jgi:hypothetical protein
MQAKLQMNAQHDLANLSLWVDNETGGNTFSFGEADKIAGNFINLPQCQRHLYVPLGAYKAKTQR